MNTNQSVFDDQKAVQLHRDDIHSEKKSGCKMANAWSLLALLFILIVAIIETSKLYKILETLNKMN